MSWADTYTGYSSSCGGCSHCGGCKYGCCFKRSKCSCHYKPCYKPCPPPCPPKCPTGPTGPTGPASDCIVLGDNQVCVQNDQVIFQFGPDILGVLRSIGAFQTGTGSATSFNSHAEGNLTIASNAGAHAEGNRYVDGNDEFFTESAGIGSHAEGLGTLANASGAHAEGSGFRINGVAIRNIAEGLGAHVEGLANQTYTPGSHVQGINGLADDNSSAASVAGRDGRAILPGERVLSTANSLSQGAFQKSEVVMNYLRLEAGNNDKLQINGNVAAGALLPGSTNLTMRRNSNAIVTVTVNASTDANLVTHYPPTSFSAKDNALGTVTLNGFVLPAPIFDDLGGLVTYTVAGGGAGTDEIAIIIMNASAEVVNIVASVTMIQANY